MHADYPLGWIAGLVTASLSAQLWPSVVHAHLVVQVRGSTQLDADINPSADGVELTVQGRVRDELGEPITSARLRFEFEQPQPSTLPLTNLKGCPSGSDTTPSQEGSRINSDSEGRFCASFPQERLPIGAVMRVIFDGSEAYGPTTKTITLEDKRSVLWVKFGQLSHIVSLDETELSFMAELLPIVPNDLGDSSLPLAVELSLRSADNGTLEERHLQRLQVEAGRATRIAVPTSSLGRPGPSDLVLGFEGNPAYKPFRNSYRIERVTSVRLVSSDWPRRAVTGARFTATVRAEAGIPFPPPGFVELFGLDGAATLFALQPDGSASVAVQLPRNPTNNVVSFHYRSNTPGWYSSEPLRLSVELVPPSRWHLVAWAAAALLVLGWFAWSKRRVQPGAASTSPATLPRPYAHLEVIESAEDPDAGWSGTVVDAHEGLAIGAAVVELRRPGFGREDTLFACSTDSEGQFQIPSHLAGRETTCRLEIKASGFARLGLMLPPPGRVRVHLISVRRAILERLVNWVRGRGRPFESRTEPTPDWVAAIAAEKGDAAVAAWANAVSNAAFGTHVPTDPESPDLLPPSGGLGGRAGAKRNNQ